jgi:hypothetical protein
MPSTVVVAEFASWNTTSSTCFRPAASAASAIFSSSVASVHSLQRTIVRPDSISTGKFAPCVLRQFTTTVLPTTRFVVTRSNESSQSRMSGVPCEMPTTESSVMTFEPVAVTAADE